ncbi:MAG TPA: c-type cytochrome [Usitatibacter sp.]|nr:c-type cytochrome [Usitatibacter sp.]
MKILNTALIFAFASAVVVPAFAADDAAAEALMKKSGCFKCHSVDKKKDGPSYKEVAAKLKGKPDAEEKVYTHLTTHPKVKVEGKEETHDSLKTKDEKEIRNVVAYILSR